MGKKKTHDEYVNELGRKQPNIILMSKYNGAMNKIHCKCKIHNYSWEPTAMLALKYGCPVCSGHVITSEVYSERLKEVHGDDIILVGEYKKMVEKTMHHCNIHNVDFLITPGAVLKGQGCKYCKKEKLRKAALKSKEEAIKKLKDMYGNKFELAEEYHGASEKHLFKHNLDDGTSHTFVSTFSLLYLGEGCGVCRNKQINIGYNDIATTNPYIASLFADPDDTHKYVELSNQKVKFKCPICGQISDDIISKVVKRGYVSCKFCGDGISYPNKFIFNILNQIRDKLDFLEREYSADWCAFMLNNKAVKCRYDIYFGIHYKKYIIEMDGGFHEHPHIKSKFNYDDIYYIDDMKTKLAIQNNINIIRIDCIYPLVTQRFEYIKNNILSSELKNIIDLNDIDFDKANVMSLGSLLIESCDLWNKGHSVQTIANTLHLTSGTIRVYLESASKYNLCDYSTKENRIRSNSCRKVICLNTLQTYDSISSAASLTKIVNQSISACCQGKVASAGKQNGERLVWMYYDEYLELDDSEIMHRILRAYNKKVVCVSKNLLFLDPTDASKWIHRTPSAISKCCTKETKYCGKDIDTGESLKWMYYSEYKEKHDVNNLILVNKGGDFIYPELRK